MYIYCVHTHTHVRTHVNGHKRVYRDSFVFFTRRETKCRREIYICTPMPKGQLITGFNSYPGRLSIPRKFKVIP